MATNSLAHINASTQGHYNLTSVIPKHSATMARKYTHSDVVLGEAASSRAKGVYIDIHDFCEGAQPTKLTAKARNVYASFSTLYYALLVARGHDRTFCIREKCST